MPQTDRVVITNLTQCYHCHRLLRPQEGVQRRQVVTGGTVGRARWLLLPFLSFPTREAHFEWVALCPACTQAYDAQEHAEQVHNGKKFAFWSGSLIVIVSAWVLGAPWWVTVPLAAACTYYGVLWEVILAGLSLSAFTHFCLHWEVGDYPRQSLPLFAVAIGVVLWAKVVTWRRRTAAPVRQAQPSSGTP
jgi:hypothetical protein